MASKSTPVAPGAGEAPKATSEPVEEVVIEDEVVGNKPDKKFIQYIGEATSRIISKKDWKGLDIEAETTEWNLANDFKVETSKLDDKQAHYLLKLDGRFRATDK